MSTYIRLATSDDVPVIVKMNREGLKHYRWTYDENYIYRSISHGGYYVLRHGNEIVGSIKFYKEQLWLWISALTVFKKYRGKGYARNMMRFAMRLARECGYNRIRLDTLTLSKAGKFYEKMGYQLVKEEPYHNSRYRVYEKKLKNIT